MFHDSHLLHYPATFRRMSTVVGCIFKYVCGIHPHKSQVVGNVSRLPFASLSSNFQTDEYCRELYFQVCVRHTSSQVVGNVSRLPFASLSSNFQTDEYCRGLYFQVCVRNTSSHDEGQRFKSQWGVETKTFWVAKEDFTSFISIKYDKLCPILKKEMITGTVLKMPPQGRYGKNKILRQNCSSLGRFQISSIINLFCGHY
jgi:hypothetical protein